MTSIPSQEGLLYLTVVLDLIDRKPIGWSISEGMKTTQTDIPEILMAARIRAFCKEMAFTHNTGQSVRLPGHRKDAQIIWGHSEHEPKRDLLGQFGAEKFFQISHGSRNFGNQASNKEPSPSDGIQISGNRVQP
jgi:hypothetical protein